MRAVKTSGAVAENPVENPAVLPEITMMPAITVAAKGIARKARSLSTPRAGGFSLKLYSVVNGEGDR